VFVILFIDYILTVLLQTLDPSIYRLAVMYGTAPNKNGHIRPSYGDVSAFKTAATAIL